MSEMYREFAQALFEMALEDDSADETLSALETVRAVFRETPEFAELLASPAIPRKERFEVIDSALTGRVPEKVAAFLKALCARGCVRSFDKCADAYAEMHHEARGLCEAEVASAAELTEEEKTRLTQALEKKLNRRVMLRCRVDASLLGGVVVRADGKVFDGSLKRRLQQIKEVMQA